jgi:PPOX class probable F420-dependent enzyme
MTTGFPSHWCSKRQGSIAAAAATCQYHCVGKNERAKIVMTDGEIAEFIDHSRTATMATVLPSGRPHLVAMWYAVLDGEIWFETKAKSQKAVNLRRDPTITVMIEDGLSYDTLRGVSIDGEAEIIDDPETNMRVGISVWERYTGPYSDEMKPFVEQMMNNRVSIRVVPKRMRSWDHRKLGMQGMPISGSTAQYLS